MGSSVFQIALFAIGGCTAGALVAWLIQAVRSKRRIATLTHEARQNIAEVSAQRDAFGHRISRFEEKIEQLQASNRRKRAQLESAVEKAKLLAGSVLTLRTEREDTKIKVGSLQNALLSVKQQSADLQREFEKTREFYKRELLKNLKKRKDLEQEVKDARAEQEEFSKLIESSTLEHGSEENMVVAAQLRLGQLEVLTRNVSKLEAEAEQLRQEKIQLKKDFQSRSGELKELDELKLHNKQLVRAVEALETSRQEHESEAERYREQADESEKLSDTLRLKLDDLEKNFADIEKQQDRAINEAREAAVVPLVRKQS